MIMINMKTGKSYVALWKQIFFLNVGHVITAEQSFYTIIFIVTYYKWKLL